VAGSVCADSGGNHAGFTLTFQPQWINNAGLNVANAITRGAPVRGYDAVLYRVYQGADGNWYWDRRTCPRAAPSSRWWDR